jgi:hypothetical protein
MNVIYGMLAEEKKRNINMQQAYRSELEKLPKGTICKKIIGNKVQIPTQIDQRSERCRPVF